ncbi:MBL fold metallo-hydrolase [Falsiroseomonas tokyonensis]|uniref:MBL fold metallo-hydrolase n=1 Tax=Falsiroseomonas tokyonensis TaxID=430521 RepID=A0ABV7BU11_9PROT|nr:MBL fold metallo-hydrolase [Falsiroseomonas tokyonensis]MBU8539134.1 MBL fold metallo-hydrolase [Falsiroseomonas tokyonensis]
MDRRHLMLGAAGALAAPALWRASPALAQGAPAAAPAPLAQPPGFYRFRVGSRTVTMLHDGSRAIPLAQGFVPATPLAEVQRVLAESFLPTDTFRIPFTLTCLETPNGLVLFDTGNGPQPAGAPVGLLAANMRAAGLDPARVTTVVFSHFHGDHVGGLLNADGSAAFPNAELVVPASEWAWWTDTGNESRSPESQRGTFPNVARRFAPYQGKVRQIAADAEVLPGVTAIAAHGHTPGHTVYRIADGAEQLIFLADLTNRPELFARRPDFRVAFDFDPAAAEATRRRILDMVSTDRIRVTGYHFPFPATGHMAKDGQGYRFVASDWSAAG